MPPSGFPNKNKIAGTPQQEGADCAGEANSFRSDIAMLASYAELYRVPKTLILNLRSENARRRFRMTPLEAVEALNTMGLHSSLFKGDLRDLEEMDRPVLALMKSTAFALVLLVEPRVVVTQVGHRLHPQTLKRQEFDKLWLQSWIASTSPTPDLKSPL